MLKKLLIVLFFISSLAQSQHFIKGTMSPVDEDVTWVALYRLKGAKQIYIQNVTLEEGAFQFEVPANSPKGMYRIRYKMNASGNLDFIYNQEDMVVEFDPSSAIKTIQFLNSEDNKLYYSFLNQTILLKEQLDALQYNYFRLATIEEKVGSRKLYKSSLLKYTKIQEDFEAKSKDLHAYHFIKAGRKYYNESLFESQQEYLNSEKAHYFDYMDFSNTYLQNSTEITQSILNYVFYFNISEDPDVQFTLHKNAINGIMAKLEGDTALKKEVITTLLSSFAEDENIKVMDFLMANYYDKLPETYKNKSEIKIIFNKVKLAVGKKAPDFSWDEEGESKSLYTLDDAPTYVLVFWSTTCSHCVVEVPKLYEYLKGSSNIHVVDVALENDELGYNIYSKKFQNWTNVLGLGKWQNPIARNYKIVSTPTYFILDADKKIIAKPEHLSDLKEFVEKL